jgi:hypothetical protein
MVGLADRPPGKADAPSPAGSPFSQPPRAATGAWWIVRTR